MPTKRQIEQINQIKDPITRRKYAKLLQLPKRLQDTMFAIETADIVWRAARDNDLTSEQLWQFSYIVGMILLGETHITEFIKSIQEKCGLPYEKSRDIARQINKELFLPIKDDLKIIHKIPKWPREEESVQPAATPAPLPAQPPLQDRIKTEQENRTINLKRE